MKNKEHLPLLGVGPIYVISIVLPTAVSIYLNTLPAFSSGKVPVLHIPFIIIGSLFLLLSLVLWIQGAIVAKLDENIRKNVLVTTGVYAWVRNPIYSAFMMLCTGVLLVAGNVWLFGLPLLYWLWMTVLMKLTEEKWLLKKYGDEYSTYCKKVNRCWPWIPKK